jgi:tight adherence protein B
MNSLGFVPVVFGLLAISLTLLIGVVLPKLINRYQKKFERKVGDSLRSAFVFLDSRQVLGLQTFLIALTGTCVWLLFGHVLLVFLSVLGVGLVPHLALYWIQRHRRSAFRAQLPDAIMVIASALRAGNGFALALNHVASELAPPISQEIELVLRECKLGSTLHDSLQSLEQRFPSEEIRLFNAAIQISQKTGGNLSETLEALAGAMRSKMQIEGKLAALTSQGKMQGIIVGLLPFAVLFMVMAIEPDLMNPLFSTSAGWTACALIGIFELLGALCIRRIVRIVV